MTSNNDVTVLRGLALQVAGIAARDVMDDRRELWRRHNSLERTRPLLLVLGMPYWGEVFDDKTLKCTDPFYRRHERAMWQTIYQSRLLDDTVIEPWVTLGAVYETPPDDARRWGPPIKWIPSPEARGSKMFDPPILEEADLARLVTPRHAIDEAATERDFQRLSEAVGDVITVNLDRRPFWFHWTADLSTDVARLRGLEQFMLDMVDRPAWLHKLMAFLRDGVLAAHAQAEAAGDFALCDHQNQAMCYCRDLADPAANARGVDRGELWTFCASQETTAVSPAMFDEFMLQYQKPIVEKFGLSAYGCCEDLTRKFHLVKQLSNLRRFSVTPWADVARCAEQIGQDYVLSWRPSPAEMICRGFDPERVKRLTREGLAAAGDCHVDITLKDADTIGGRFDDLIEWTRIVRDIVENQG